MAFVAGKNARIISGTLPWSGYCNQTDLSITPNTTDTTVLTSSGKESIPTLNEGKLSLAGFVEVTTEDPYAAALPLATSGDVFSFAPAGFALGNVVYVVQTNATSYPIAASVDKAVAFKLDVITTGTLDHGQSLADLAQIGTTTTGSSYDNTAATANGGASMLHVTQYAGITNVIVKVQHSVDNSSWADLVTHTTATTTTSERAVVAPATTVRRYLRSVATVSGAGTVTFQHSFCRR